MYTHTYIYILFSCTSSLASIHWLWMYILDIFMNWLVFPPWLWAKCSNQIPESVGKSESHSFLSCSLYKEIHLFLVAHFTHTWWVWKPPNHFVGGFQDAFKLCWHIYWLHNIPIISIVHKQHSQDSKKKDHRWLIGYHHLSSYISINQPICLYFIYFQDGFNGNGFGCFFPAEHTDPSVVMAAGASLGTPTALVCSIAA